MSYFVIVVDVDVFVVVIAVVADGITTHFGKTPAGTAGVVALHH